MWIRIRNPGYLWSPGGFSESLAVVLHGIEEDKNHFSWMTKKLFNPDSKQFAPYLAGLLLKDHGGILDLDPARLQILKVWIIHLHSFSN
jgi:hypothetical protein